MPSVRRALAFATGDKYVTALLSLGTTAIVSRMILPADFGIAVLGGATLALAQAVRELGSAAFIIQSPDLTTAKLRTVFTVNLLTTIILAGALLAGAPVLAGWFKAPGLEDFLPIAALAFLTGTIAFPLHAALARDLKFNKIAIINILSAIVNASVLILCASMGLSFLSFAWASAASALAGTLLLIWMRPQFSIFRLELSAWREVLSFSVFTGGSALLQKLSEFLSLAVMNIALSPVGVGLLHRAAMICQFPERTVLAGVNAVAFSAFSDQHRRKKDMSASYLGAIDRLTVVIWPSLGFIILYAHVLVTLLLGENWGEVVPLVQIIAAAMLLNFPPGINYPLIIATGNTKRVFYVSLAQVSISLPILIIAAQFGITAVAWSTFAVVGAGVVLSTFAVRSVAAFSWKALARVLQRSCVVSLVAMSGPALVRLFASTDHVGVGAMLLAALLAVVGWLVGLKLMNHAMLDEVLRALRALQRRSDQPRA